MPKQLKIIDDFSGGENSFGGSRKIEDNELVKLQNLSVGANGIIKSGSIGTVLNRSGGNGIENGLDPYPSHYASNIKPGHNVFSFSSDRHYNGTQNEGTEISGEDWVAIADHQGSNKVHIFGRFSGISK